MIPYLASHLRFRTRRAGLVLLAVATGAALFVALTALGDGFREAARAPLADIDTDLQLTRPGGENGEPPERGLRTPDGLDTFTEQEVQELIQLDAVEGAAGSVTLWDFGARQTVTVLGLDTENEVGPALMLEENLLRGRAFVPGEEGVVTADRHYAAFYDLDVGSTVQVGDAELEVIGITEVPGASQATVANLALPIQQAREMAGLEEGEVNQVHLALSDAGAAEAVASEAEQHLGAVSALTEDSLVQVFGAVGEVSTRFAAAAAGVGLLGGAALSWTAVRGLVRERTREIGLLQTTGWLRRDITRIFIAESAILSSLGGAAGVALGWGAAAALSRMPLPDLAPDAAHGGYGPDVAATQTTLPLLVDPLNAAVAILAATAAGTLAGWTASRRAAARSPLGNLGAL